MTRWNINNSDSLPTQRNLKSLHDSFLLLLSLVRNMGMCSCPYTSTSSRLRKLFLLSLKYSAITYTYICSYASYARFFMNCSICNMPRCLVLYKWFLSGNGLLFCPCFEALAELSSKDRKGWFLVSHSSSFNNLIFGIRPSFRVCCPRQDLLGRY